MKTNDFIRAIESYYGEYSVAQKNVMQVYISKFPQHLLSKLYLEATKRIESKYKTPPDVAALLPMMNEIKEQDEHDMLVQATALRLPDASEVVSKEEAARFMSTLMSAIAKGGDPREDEDVRALLRKHGVDAQVQGEMSQC